MLKEQLPEREFFAKLFQASFVLLIVGQLLLSILLLQSSCYAGVVQGQVQKGGFVTGNKAILSNCLLCAYNKNTPSKQKRVNTSLTLIYSTGLDIDLISGINVHYIGHDIGHNDLINIFTAHKGVTYVDYGYISYSSALSGYPSSKYIDHTNEIDSRNINITNREIRGEALLSLQSYKELQHQGDILFVANLDVPQLLHLTPSRDNIFVVEAPFLDRSLVSLNNLLVADNRLITNNLNHTRFAQVSSPNDKLIDGNNKITITTECVYLDEVLGSSYPTISIQCGFSPGDTKSIPIGTIYATFERAGLIAPNVNQQFFTVYRQGEEISGDDIKSELEELYQSRYPNKEIVIDSVKVGKGIFVDPTGTRHFIVDLDKFGSATGTISTGSTKHSFSYMARIYEMAHVATARVYKGEELVGSTSYERIETTYQRKNVVTDVATVIAGRTISKGRVITEDMVSMKPERRKGDMIILIYQSGDIKLEIMGIAEGDAVIGKSFPVRNPSSDKVINAIYQGDGKALVY